MRKSIENRGLYQGREEACSVLPRSSKWSLSTLSRRWRRQGNLLLCENHFRLAHIQNRMLHIERPRPKLFRSLPQYFVSEHSSHVLLADSGNGKEKIHTINANITWTTRIIPSTISTRPPIHLLIRRIVT
jgi:hypothetical protein